MYTTKILILDIGNGQNKGNLALFYSAIETIQKFIPESKFKLMYFGDTGSHTNSGLDEQHLIANVRFEKPKETAVSLLYLLKCFYISTFKMVGLHIPVSEKSRLFYYYESDLVVVIGGDTMSPSGRYGVNTLTPFTNILYAVILKKPTVLYGESFGYYNNEIINLIAKYFFNKISLILVREEVSYKYLESNKINKPKIYLTADSAFLLDPASKSRICNILSLEKINDIQKPLIGINASKLISRFKGKDSLKEEEDVNNIMAKVIDNLIETLDANVIMVPHVYEPTNRSDDRVAINSIYEKVKNNSKTYIIKNEYTPQELKGIIGLCDLFIGARMHSTIASTSMLVPTVGIAYSHKMYGIIGNMLGQEKYIVDIKDLSYNKLISTVYDAWNNRSKIKEELESIIPVVKERAMLNGKYVSELLKN